MTHAVLLESLKGTVVACFRDYNCNLIEPMYHGVVSVASVVLIVNVEHCKGTFKSTRQKLSLIAS